MILMQALIHFMNSKFVASIKIEYMLLIFEVQYSIIEFDLLAVLT